MSKKEQWLEDYEHWDKSCDGWEYGLRLDFAHIVMATMKYEGLSVYDIAKKSGIDKSVIVELMHANCNCSLSTIAKVCHALGVEVEIRAKVDEKIKKSS